MKNRAPPVFLKQIISMFSSIVKAKSLALKNKTSTFKTRLIISSFFNNKKLFLSSITHKLHAFVAQQDKIKDGTDEHGHHQSSDSEAIMLYHASANESQSHSYPSCTELVKVGEREEELYDDNKYPDLTHSLFDSEPDELDLAHPGGSVIDLVRNGKEDTQNFNLEDEIDHVADLFIRRFHKQMKMQKLESFKRYQEMLERSV